MIPSWLNEWLASPWLPAILALGAFADAFLLTSVFVLGELFFIAAGYTLGLTAQWWLIPLIWGSALLGDLSSYWLGQGYGERIIRRFIHKGAKRRLNYLRAKRLMQKRGGIAIFTARLTGPIAKFMPFLAGTMNVPFYTVLWASLLGVIIGTIQFFIIGWLVAVGGN